MMGLELKKALEQAGYGVDQVKGTNYGGSARYCCRIDQATVRKLLNNKNWTPISGFFENNMLYFWVHQKRKRQ